MTASEITSSTLGFYNLTHGSLRDNLRIITKTDKNYHHGISNNNDKDKMEY